MPILPANVFISPFKFFAISKVADQEKTWMISDRVTKEKIGYINWTGNTWDFFSEVNHFKHLQLLDIAAAIKTVEKRTLAPKLYV